jgi:peptide/nickel transport system permease protein
LSRSQNFYVRRLGKVHHLGSVHYFLLIRLLPGNPVEQYIARLIETQGMDYENARTQAAALFAINLDAPLWQQYGDYLWNLLHLNLGVSITSPGTPVTAIVARFLPWTIFSVGIGLIFVSPPASCSG